MSPPRPLRPAIVALQRRAFSDVLQLTRPWLQDTDRSVRALALRLSSEAALELGALPLASKTIGAALQAEPNDGHAWFLSGRVLEAFHQPDNARQAYAKATRLDPSLARAWLAHAELVCTSGDQRQSADILHQGMLRNPARFELPERLLPLLMEIGPEPRLRTLIASVIRRFPQRVAAHYMVAQAEFMLGNTTAAMDHLSTAIRLDPGHLPARSLRAEYRLRSQDPDGARSDLDVVLTRSPQDAKALYVRSLLRFREGRFALARADLDIILTHEDRLPTTTRALARVRRGLCHDANGQYDLAYKDIATGQLALDTGTNGQHLDTARYLGAIDQLKERFTEGGTLSSTARDWPHDVPAHWPLAGSPPVFIFGFPRSGTTLAEQVLGAHPMLAPTDERDVLSASIRALPERLRNAPHLAATDVELIQLRKAYENRARALVPSGNRVVDKVPLNFIHLAWVRRIFPDAPIIQMIRDPRDCVWSAFVQTFAPNVAMKITTTLEGTARLYDTTMGFWLQARHLPGLRYTELRFEEFVSDIHQGARSLVAAAGLPWNDNVLQYKSQLRSQTVRTPSFNAIAKPVSRRPVGRWRHYRAAMEPILPVLEPYVEAFGYPPSDP